MIKIFRRIRQNLLMENKTGTYLKYAIGEIILVVIGIIIALQINNWNEKRKEQTKEVAILNELHREFSDNLVQFERVKASHVRSLQACRILIRNMETRGQPSSLDSIAQYGPAAFSGGTFNPSDGMVESLINSGTLQLIRNDSLRRQLVSWREVYGDYYEEEVEIGNFWRQTVEPYMIKNGDFVNPGNRKNLHLIEDPVFRNIVARRLFYVYNVARDVEMEYSLREIVRLSKQ